MTESKEKYLSPVMFALAASTSGLLCVSSGDTGINSLSSVTWGGGSPEPVDEF